MKITNNVTETSHICNSLAMRVTSTALALLLCATGSAAIAQGDELPFGNPLDIQSASQSSTDFDAPARLAFDGNTNGRFRDGSVTHTSASDTFQPSWTGDIGGVTDIINVRVFNRTDTRSRSRLSNYYVLVSELPFKSQSLDVSLSDPDVTSFFRDGLSSTQDFDTIPTFTRGRFVRIQLSGDAAPLSLAEVQVFGNDSVELPQRVAPASVSQSSTAFNAPAQRAVDQNTDGDFGAGSVTHTENTFQPFWSATLGDGFDISEIRIWNRTGRTSGRLSNFYVLVSDVPFRSDSLADSLADSNVDAFFVPEITVGSGDERLDSDTIEVNTSGRFVRIQLQGTNPLSLAEVEIFGIENDSVPQVGIFF